MPYQRSPLAGAMNLIAYVWSSIPNWARTPSLPTKAFAISDSTSFLKSSNAPSIEEIILWLSRSVPMGSAARRVTLRVKITRPNAWPQGENTLIIGGTESGDKRMIRRSVGRTKLAMGRRRAKTSTRNMAPN